jgi:hypothetical protein
MFRSLCDATVQERSPRTSLPLASPRAWRCAPPPLASKVHRGPRDPRFPPKATAGRMRRSMDSRRPPCFCAWLAVPEGRQKQRSEGAVPPAAGRHPWSYASDEHDARVADDLACGTPREKMVVLLMTKCWKPLQRSAVSLGCLPASSSSQAHRRYVQWALRRPANRSSYNRPRSSILGRSCYMLLHACQMMHGLALTLCSMSICGKNRRPSENPIGSVTGRFPGGL